MRAFRHYPLAVVTPRMVLPMMFRRLGAGWLTHQVVLASTFMRTSLTIRPNRPKANCRSKRAAEPTAASGELGVPGRAPSESSRGVGALCQLSIWLASDWSRDSANHIVGQVGSNINDAQLFDQPRKAGNSQQASAWILDAADQGGSNRDRRTWCSGGSLSRLNGPGVHLSGFENRVQRALGQE